MNVAHTTPYVDWNALAWLRYLVGVDPKRRAGT